jgi:hydroxyacyl-ACP dehydratase HTD2-like protein with hotdog domain
MGDGQVGHPKSEIDCVGHRPGFVWFLHARLDAAALEYWGPDGLEGLYQLFPILRCPRKLWGRANLTRCFAS